jgi:hypothetical protein
MSIEKQNTVDRKEVKAAAACLLRKNLQMDSNVSSKSSSVVERERERTNNAACSMQGETHVAYLEINQESGN